MRSTRLATALMTRCNTNIYRMFCLLLVIMVCVRFEFRAWLNNVLRWNGSAGDHGARKGEQREKAKVLTGYDVRAACFAQATKNGPCNTHAEWVQELRPSPPPPCHRQEKPSSWGPRTTSSSSCRALRRVSENLQAHRPASPELRAPGPELHPEA